MWLPTIAGLTPVPMCWPTIAGLAHRADVVALNHGARADVVAHDARQKLPAFEPLNDRAAPSSLTSISNHAQPDA